MQDTLRKPGILFLFYRFAPIKGIGTIRNYSIATESRPYFSNVEVISTANASFLPQEDLPEADQLKVHRVSTFDFRTFLHLFKQNAKTVKKTYRQRSTLSRLIKLQKTFPFNLFFGESGLVYILCAYWQACQIIKKGNTQYIFSSYSPYADHIVAWLLKWRFPHLEWIADFRDPQVDLNYTTSYSPKSQMRLNAFLLKKASLITTVSEGLAQHFARYERPVYVLRNGIKEELHQMVEPQLPYEKFTITYTGTIYQERQLAAPMFKALQHLLNTSQVNRKHIQLVYAGNHKHIWDAWIKEYDMEDISTSYDILPLTRSLVIQKKGHLNLLMSWSGPAITGILTGKLYEYLMAERPILTIINGQHDQEFEQLFAELGAGHIHYLHQNIDTVAQFINSQYRQWLIEGYNAWAFHPPAKAELEWPNQIAAFYQYLAVSPEKVALPVPIKERGIKVALRAS